MPDSIEQIENPPTIDRTPKYTPVDKVRELITVRGLSYTEAAKILGISFQAVSQMCKRHGIMSNNALKRFKSTRADIMAAKQAQLIHSIEDDDIKKASAYQRVGMFGILYDKERLERGQTTENVGYADYTAAIEELDRQLREAESDTPKQVDLDDYETAQDAEIIE